MTFLGCLSVAIGGAVGSLARYALREWLTRPGDSFPWHTFLTNIIGSFILGIIAVACKDRPNIALLLGVGFCGGFTTFSTFSVETMNMIESNRWGMAILYVFGSVAGGLIGVWLGMRLLTSPAIVPG